MSNGLGLGVNLWSQASDWPAFLRAAQRADELGFDHLWTWDHLLAIFGEPDQPIFEGYAALAAVAASTSRIRAGPLRRRQHVPAPRAGGQGDHHHRPHQRRPRRPGHRRGVVRGGAPGLRPRLRVRVRAAPGLAGRGRPGDARAPRRRGGHERARRALRVRRPADQPAAAPGTPADHDRRRRRAEDAAHRRGARRHLERLRDARGPRPQGRRAAGALRRRRAGPGGDRADGRVQDHDPLHRGRGRARPPGDAGAQPDAARGRRRRRDLLDRHARADRRDDGRLPADRLPHVHRRARRRRTTTRRWRRWCAW